MKGEAQVEERVWRGREAGRVRREGSHPQI